MENSVLLVKKIDRMQVNETFSTPNEPIQNLECTAGSQTGPLLMPSPSPDIGYEYRVIWDNSNRKFKSSICLFSFSIISHCERVILGPRLNQNTLYPLEEESLKKYVIEKIIVKIVKVVLT
jgi:hypothetical protein